ncbi:hypothetical protein MASR2M78_35740 [Treponema sp.]
MMNKIPSAMVDPAAIPNKVDEANKDTSLLKRAMDRLDITANTQERNAAGFRNRRGMRDAEKRLMQAIIIKNA